ncbi:hypothetical protein [Hymenobacter sp. CRA2]|uniref:hypothetical protein n=1 Tax=Hymenobacter sp. CRA2 TaxID=1955620 RepID=UPI00098F6045|nr:hypothetical protein [Hymenobacter sp. CRA2]OON69241.1 hypothetical protein B0919_08040 [Hymenobacter sp. CRA2]
MQPTPSPPRNYFGRVLLVHLILVLLIHVGRQLLFDDPERTTIFFVLVLIAVLDAVCFFVMLVTGRWRQGLAYAVAALLVFLIGFGDCATHFHLGPMN